jgi:hypothetical protein
MLEEILARSQKCSSRDRATLSKIQDRKTVRRRLILIERLCGIAGQLEN